MSNSDEVMFSELKHCFAEEKWRGIRVGKSTKFMRLRKEMKLTRLKKLLQSTRVLRSL